jgi:hypothetical protein
MPKKENMPPTAVAGFAAAVRTNARSSVGILQTYRTVTF